ncbi:MAG: hypothetical protein V7744_20430 [Pseudomonadales bacterium]
MALPSVADVMLRSYDLIRQLAMENELDFLAFNQVNLMTPVADDIE